MTCLRRRHEAGVEGVVKRISFCICEFSFINHFAKEDPRSIIVREQVNRNAPSSGQYLENYGYAWEGLPARLPATPRTVSCGDRTDGLDKLSLTSTVSQKLEDLVGEFWG